MKRRTRRWLERLVPLAVSAAALSWLFATLEVSALVDALSWSVAAVLVPALLAYGAFSLWLEARSLRRLVRRAPPGFGAWTAARVKCASYLLGIVSYALGAGALTVLLRRRAGIGLGESASVVLMISSLDLLLLLLLAGIGAATGPADAGVVRVGVAALFGFGFFGGLVLVRAPLRMAPLERVRSLAIFEVLRHTPMSILLEVALLRLCFTVAFIALGGSAFAAFGVAVQAGELVVGIMVVALVAALPIAVAGLGTGQLAFVTVFRGLAEPELLLAVSLVLSAGLILLRVGMGLAFAREFTREALAQTRAEAAQ
jgi:hypothetical protein